MSSMGPMVTHHNLMQAAAAHPHAAPGAVPNMMVPPSVQAGMMLPQRSPPRPGGGGASPKRSMDYDPKSETQRRYRRRQRDRTTELEAEVEMERQRLQQISSGMAMNARPGRPRSW